ncbi:hypothetical protein LCGC14_0607990 [marine sediment metagenome]|uniref:Uncharacterized protein n=1 Tax=marine sediment metagenome TaxID=412755 RepID=A0A0F9UH25_9ZZZZ
MKRKHYRVTPAPPPLLPALNDSQDWLRRFAGGFRTAPFTLAVDTDRWYQRGPEQLNLSLKNVQGAFLVELAHSIRRPRYHEPIIWSDKKQRFIRAPDIYHQHTRSWRYCLDNASHARAFQQLLQHAVAYVSGHDAGASQQVQKFKHLYWLDIGVTEELARWPIRGISGVVDGKLQQGLDGYEVLEVVGLPGERPRRPKTLCGPRPHEKAAAAHYDGVKQHWHQQLQGCRSRQMELRVRRVHGPTNEPAFFINGATEMDLPLWAIRGLMRQLPSFWKTMYEAYEKEAGLGWPRLDKGEAKGQERIYEVLPALWMTRKQRRDHFWHDELDQHGRKTGKIRRERETLSGQLNDQRQFCWNQPVMERFLSPSAVESVCAEDPQDGLWAQSWDETFERGSEDYQKRLALWGAGLLRWDTEWSVGVGDAFDDLTSMQLHEQDQLKYLLRMFLVCSTIRYTQCAQPRPSMREPLRLTSYVGRHKKQARGPPGRQ